MPDPRADADLAAEVQDAFAALGLDPAADADLVELAYWHHVEVCRATLLGTPAWRARMADLNRVRLVLNNTARQRALLPQSAPAEEPDPASPSLWLRLPSLLAPPLILLAFIAATRNVGWDWGAILAYSFGLLAVMTFVSVAVVGAMQRRAPPAAGSDPDPYHALHVHQSADHDLIAIAFRHLLRVAIVTSDSDALDALERAYARVGTPAARAAYDMRAAAVAAAPDPEAPDTHAAAVAGQDLSARRRRLAAFRRRGMRPKRAGGRAAPAKPVAQWGPEHEDPVPEPRRAARGQPIGTLHVMEAGCEVVTLVLRDASVYTIGAGAHCDVRLPVPAAEAETVAAEHARITARRGRVLFHHLDPQAASLVNGERVTWVVLEPGDTLSIGPYRCHYLASGADAQLPAEPPHGEQLAD